MRVGSRSRVARPRVSLRRLSSCAQVRLPASLTPSRDVDASSSSCALVHDPALLDPAWGLIVASSWPGYAGK
ncbi:hypothetical protein F2Q68_00026727 [Brassica cretica]|uniref:Uncharacterized protein n=1 Tax=Brassica cretica TaxID=69181 RepID=A0A8S9IET3_BRACR|nr:hypothetical protein F2Q68_00026727 [Brassica cretica]